MKAYVKFETPKEISDLFADVASIARETGKIKKGVNEVTKSVERGNAKLVVMAGDVEPEELLVHIPTLCEEKGIAFIYHPTKDELGKLVGLIVPTSAIAIEDAGNAKEKLRTLVERVSGKSEKKEEKKEHKPKKEEKKEHKPKEEKKEAKKETKKEEKKEEPKVEKEAKKAEKKEEPKEEPKEEKKE